MVLIHVWSAIIKTVLSVKIMLGIVKLASMDLLCTSLNRFVKSLLLKTVRVLLTEDVGFAIKGTELMQNSHVKMTVRLRAVKSAKMISPVQDAS